MKKLTIIFTIITLMFVANTALLAAAPTPASKPSNSTSVRLISKKDVFYFKFMYNKKGKNVQSAKFAC